MSSAAYPIAIEPGDDRHAFGVVVPDLPGCFSAGDTFDEAIENAREAIEQWMVLSPMRSLQLRPLMSIRRTPIFPPGCGASLTWISRIRQKMEPSAKLPQNARSTHDGIAMGATVTVFDSGLSCW